jgi:hypothetical protein
MQLKQEKVYKNNTNENYIMHVMGKTEAKMSFD